MGAALLFTALAVQADAPPAFAAFDAGLPRDGQWRQGFALADFDGDGRLDLAHGPPRKGAGGPVVFLGDAQGGWRLWSEAAFPARPYAYGDAAAGDFNGDGHVDLALAMHGLGIVLLAGDGRGRFEAIDAGLPVGEGDVRAGFTSRAIAAVDWNRDGRLDLAAMGEGPIGFGAPGTIGSRGLRLFLNADGPWRRVAADEEIAFGDGVAAGDFNGDGWPDAAFTSNSMGVDAVVALNDKQGGWLPVKTPDISPRTLITAVAAGDLNGDGRDEWVAAWSAWDADRAPKSGLSLVSWDGGGFAVRPLDSDQNRPLTALAIGDVDGDGAADIVTGGQDGGIRLFRGGATVWSTADPAAVTGEGRCYCLELADADGDGADEILAGFAREADAGGSSGSIRVWKWAGGPAS